MKSIDQAQFKGKRVLVRVDYNVPLNENLEVVDTTRIVRTFDTVKKITQAGGIVILMSHLGRPKGEVKASLSLKNIVKSVSEVMQHEVVFLGDVLDENIKERVAALHEGVIALLENLRFHKEEEMGDVDFAKSIAQLGDIYVNDAFGTAHREHASTATIAQFFKGNAFAGYLLYNEVDSIKTVLENPRQPFTAIIGGAKISSKIDILYNLLDKVDNLIVVGGMCYTFLNAMGVSIGNSLFEEEMVPTAKDIIKKAHRKGVTLCLPIDNVCSDKFSNDSEVKITVNNNIDDGWEGLDIGPQTIKRIVRIINTSKTILWNGPAGVFEFSHFENGTKAVCISIASATLAGSYSLVGGGDSIAALAKFGFTDYVSYVSTGGGAMLEYLEGKILPGIKALDEN